LDAGASSDEDGGEKRMRRWARLCRRRGRVDLRRSMSETKRRGKRFGEEEPDSPVRAACSGTLNRLGPGGAEVCGAPTFFKAPARNEEIIQS